MRELANDGAKVEAQTRVSGQLEVLKESIAELYSLQSMIADRVFRINGYPLEKAKADKSDNRLVPNSLVDALKEIHGDLLQLTERNRVLFDYLKENI